MGRATILIDDFDGKTLNADTKPIHVTMGSESWDLYLSSKNAQALRKAIDPFVKTADTATAASTRARSAKTRARRSIATTAPKRDLESIRQWARANDVEVKDRGRIAQAVIDQYDAAHA
ncbi:Lsr2-like protein [Intrasporangium chromatireducens Q5-1]|uniref:Lsr2-like protein n=2 Tax=Intrasporangium TaxID=53357 RepID=W9GL43_9MICO|nr:Lsr2-like protein [Intrasporangium chromatireducens Q5-1]